MKLKVLGALLAATTVASGSQAAILYVTYTTSQATIVPDNQATLNVQKFNLAGTLLDVNLAIYGRVVGTIGLEQMANTPTGPRPTLNGTLGSEVSLYAPGADIDNDDALVVTLPNIQKSFQAPRVVDGTADFAGTGGTTFNVDTGFVANDVDLDAGDFATYTGSGFAQSLVFAHGTSTTGGSSNMQSKFTNTTYAYAEVTYTYFVPDQVPDVPSVPEAATWAMMLVGFGAMGATLRRRRPAVTFG